MWQVQGGGGGIANNNSQGRISSSLNIMQVDMKLEIQRVNQKINKLEELMTNFLEQISTNNLQVTQVQQSPQVLDTGVHFF